MNSDCRGGDFHAVKIKAWKHTKQEVRGPETGRRGKGKKGSKEVMKLGVRTKGNKAKKKNGRWKEKEIKQKEGVIIISNKRKWVVGIGNKGEGTKEDEVRERGYTCRQQRSKRR